MGGVKDFAKKQAVVMISAAAAVISCLFVPVTNYADYIDTDIIGVLFALMASVAGFSENNVFSVIAYRAAKGAGNTRRLAFILVMTVFFVSMLVTNDVALITFVPFTLMVYDRIKEDAVYVIVLETIAANMGSAFTPFGNPQNLYLFSASGMSAGEFFSITSTVTVVSFILLIAAIIPIKKKTVAAAAKNDDKIVNIRYLVLYGILFILAVLSVFDVIDTVTVFISACIVTAIIQPKILARIDYGLLVTFICFFIFVGNVKNIPEVTEFIGYIMNGREFEVSLIASQVISNVPAAMMLSAFTDNYKALILGTDIGGLGTLIASLASLISYKNYAAHKGADTKRFMLVFTGMNVAFLIMLVLYAEFMILH